MKCHSCHRTVVKRAQFCPYCGAKISYRKVPASRPKKSSGGTNINWPVAIALLAIGVTIGALAMYSRSGEDSVAKSAFDPTLRGPQLASLFPNVYQVASQFMCPCGSCDDGLEVCDCDMPRGATEVRSFIYMQLKPHLPPHVIELVEKKYGHRKGGSPVPNLDKITPKLKPILPK